MAVYYVVGLQQPHKQLVSFLKFILVLHDVFFFTVSHCVVKTTLCTFAQDDRKNMRRGGRETAAEDLISCKQKAKKKIQNKKSSAAAASFLHLPQVLFLLANFSQLVSFFLFFFPPKWLKICVFLVL